jgi:radical SAM protein with 4Fe4S-binding SPASM domain
MKQLDAETYFAAVSSKALQTRQAQGVMFELTYGCNLRCVHCYNPTHRALPQELTTTEVCSIVSQIADLGVMTISFSGGEPSVRPDIAKILRHAHRQGLMIHLLTNATRMTPSFADLLEETRVSQLLVSIYGATAGTYERMTGTPGSFAHFLRGLACLTGGTIPVTIRMPVTTINVEEIDACQHLVESHGFKFQYCLEIEPRVDGDISPLQYRLDPHQKVALDSQKFGERMSAWVQEPCSTEEPFISCSCGKSRFAVTPYGEMNLCVSFPIPKYDLRKGTVREGWEILKRTVDEAQPNDHDECPTCDVRHFCRQGRADAWLETRDMSRCLPHFKEWAQLEQRAYALLDPRRPR